MDDVKEAEVKDAKVRGAPREDYWCDSEAAVL